jgi:alpha-ketoglutarate-dependent 2,4-dichlorophenoxyacetate dioxygenase
MNERHAGLSGDERLKFEITDLDIASDPSSAETIRFVQAAIDRCPVLVIRNQRLPDDDLISFATHFGAAEKHAPPVRGSQSPRLPRLIDVSNLDEHGQLLDRGDRRLLMALSNQLWHTDSSYRAIPGKYSFLIAHEVPAGGGDTEFADLRAAYDDLDEATKARIDDLTAMHSLVHSRQILGFGDYTESERSRLPPAERPIVRTLPHSGRKTLYLAAHAYEIVGWPVPLGRLLLSDLIEFATRPKYVYRHRWRPGDLLIWDNRCTMHRGRGYEYATERRDLRRITVSDGIDWATAQSASEQASKQATEQQGAAGYEAY